MYEHDGYARRAAHDLREVPSVARDLVDEARGVRFSEQRRLPQRVAVHVEVRALAHERRPLRAVQAERAGVGGPRPVVEGPNFRKFCGQRRGQEARLKRSKPPVWKSKFYGAFSTPSTRRLLDGVAMPVPHQSLISTQRPTD